MCGIAGLVHTSGQAQSKQAAIERLCLRQAHRGPDGSGLFTDGPCVLGHRRLAIIDLSEFGHQPMTSHCGRWTIAYNGEIYNFRELARELEGLGSVFRGHSDTEVLLESYARWGRGTLERLRGIFAFAIWDAREQTLFLARDQLGVKPLIYAERPGEFWFASEVGALAGELNETIISPGAVADFLTIGYIAAPDSVYPGIRKLEAGTWIEVNGQGRITERRRYWDPLAIRANGLLPGTPSGFSEEFARLLEQACARQMVADVPVGLFLSSGLDSQAVALAASRGTGKPLRTFTMGEATPHKNEAPLAEAFARLLGSKHTTFTVRDAEVETLLPQIATLFGEPFGDIAAISTYLLSRLARSEATVVLSGDGGDEFLFGYDRYTRGLTHEKIRRLAVPAKHILKTLGRGRGDRLYRFAAARDDLDLYVMGRSHLRGRTLNEIFVEPDELRLGSSLRTAQQRIPPELPLEDKMMLFDQITYLEGNNLTRVDRMSMIHSLEIRVPLLDLDLVEFLLRVPASVKYRNGETKYPLRQYLARFAPREMFHHRKRGFSLDKNSLLRGTLRPLLIQPVSPELCREYGLRSAGIETVKRRYFSGENSLAPFLWNLLMLMHWHKEASPPARRFAVAL